MRREVIAATIARWAVGGTFIFSGLVKSVDPVGTSIFVDEYLAAYSLEGLGSLSLAAAVVLGAAELSVGVMLCLRLMTRAASASASAMLAVFTVVTLLSATVLPVGDCGCFGDALSLSPWATFFKNVVLLPLAVWTYMRHRRDTLSSVWRLRAVAAAATVVAALGINAYALSHLPLIDFMPYKVGVDLASGVRRERAEAQAARRTVLVCRNETTGERREFDADDSGWYDGWEVMETRVEEGHAESDFADFALYSFSGEELSDEVFDYASRQHLLCIRGMDRLPQRCLRRLDAFLSRAAQAGERVVCLTSDVMESDCCMAAGHVLKCYNADAMVLRSMMRSEAGVVTLDGGVIVDKRAWRDM